MAIPPTTTSTSSRTALGFIAIVEDGKLLGFNVSVGGGMGMTHGNEKTFRALPKSLVSARSTKPPLWLKMRHRAPFAPVIPR